MDQTNQWKIQLFIDPQCFGSLFLWYSSNRHSQVLQPTMRSQPCWWRRNSFPVVRSKEEILIWTLNWLTNTNHKFVHNESWSLIFQFIVIKHHWPLLSIQPLALQDGHQIMGHNKSWENCGSKDHRVMADAAPWGDLQRRVRCHSGSSGTLAPTDFAPNFTA